MTPVEQNALLLGLDRKDRVEWLPELKAGKTAFDFLKRELDLENLSANQRRNALLALFKLRSIGNGDDKETMAALVQGAKDDNFKVRSEAVKLAIGLENIVLERGQSALLTSVEKSILRSAVDVGVEKPVEDLAESFFD